MFMSKDYFNKVISNNRYTLIDLQDESNLKDCDIEDLKKYVYGIMEYRSNAIDDTLGRRYGNIIKTGYENISNDNIYEVLTTYEYYIV